MGQLVAHLWDELTNSIGDVSAHRIVVESAANGRRYVQLTSLN
jgi:hypothetical protein